MTTAKWAGLAGYVVMAGVAALSPGTQIAQAILWIFVILAAVHFVEFVVKYRVMQSAGGSMLHHFVHTLLFGFVHWRPLEQKKT
jgi:hypothetical protein